MTQAVKCLNCNCWLPQEELTRVGSIMGSQSATAMGAVTEEWPVWICTDRVSCALIVAARIQSRQNAP